MKKCILYAFRVNFIRLCRNKSISHRRPLVNSARAFSSINSKSPPQRAFYLISCSIESNAGDVKKSMIDIFNPSQIFLTVATVTLLFLPLTILFRVDWVIPQIVASLFKVIPRSSQSSSILFLTASPIRTHVSLLLYLLIYIISDFFRKNLTLLS